MFLAHAYQLAVQREQHVAVHVALQAYRRLLVGECQLPHAQIVVVGKHTNLADVHKTEVDGVGVDDELAVVAAGDAVGRVADGSFVVEGFVSGFLQFGFASRLGVVVDGVGHTSHLYADASHDVAQLGVVDRLHQVVERLVAERREHEAVVRGVHHRAAFVLRQTVDVLQKLYARDVGQLDVEEQHVGSCLVYHAQSVESVHGYAAQLGLVIRCELLCEGVGSRFVVVDNYKSHHKSFFF